MKHAGKVAIFLAGGLTLHLGARAVTPDTAGNPYSGIVDRNVFALKPPPPPPSVEDKTVTPPQKIVPTGILKYLGKKQVFFKTPVSAKAGEAPKETTLTLSEGERNGEIEVLEINVEAGTFRVKNHGIEQSLSLKEDGMKPSGTGGTGALPTPVLNAAVSTFGATMGGGQGGALTPVPTVSGAGAPTLQRPLRVTPAQPIATPQAFAPPPAASVPARQVMTPEEQIVHMEINRELTKEDVAKGRLPPLPPTPFTPPAPTPQPPPAGE